MLQYFETLTDDSGNSLLGATITVTAYPGGGAASIYNTNGTASPIPTSTQAADITGQVSFYIPDGAYILTYTYKGTVYKTKSPVQVTDPMSFVAVADSGVANAYVVNSSALPAALYVGLKVEMKAANTSTGPATLNVNATGAQPLNTAGGNALAAGAIQAGGLYRFEWDGVQWQLVGFVSQPFYGLSAAEAAAGVTPTNFSGYYGSFSRYGITTSATDNGPAITNALKCNAKVYDDFVGNNALYAVQSTIVFQAAGQILQGRGFGDNNTAIGAGAAYAPRTTLKWTGAATGVVITVYNSAAGVNFSECQINDLCIDGNNLANQGVQAYNNAVSTGAWRHQLQRLSIINCNNGAGACGIFLGNGTVNANANDFDVADCFIQNCTIGAAGGGATMGFRRTTFSGCASYGLNLSTGAFCFCHQCIFSGNGQDVNATAIQQFADDSSWFENSTNGIYKATTSHSANFHKSVLHTANSGFLINWNAAAGNCTVIGCSIAASSASNLIENHNASYEYDYTGSVIATDFIYRKRTPGPTGADTTHSGLVRVDNADFLCGITNTTAGLTGAGATAALNAYPVTIDHDYSNGGLAAATGIFTAPASGPYTFDLHLELGGLTSAMNDAQLQLVVTGTSAQTWLVARINPWNNDVAAANETHICGTRRVFMTKGDTAYMQIYVGGGASSVVTVLSGGGGNNWRTSFQGRLA